MVRQDPICFFITVDYSAYILILCYCALGSICRAASLSLIYSSKPENQPVPYHMPMRPVYNSINANEGLLDTDIEPEATSALNQYPFQSYPCLQVFDRRSFPTRPQPFARLHASPAPSASRPVVSPC